ncbi:hypothetical protein AAFF_G00113800 [Aldrovandia affinis]|uniref:Uncharacterized protein n=1 Tax=Aldrovandia affinis TaxID=143900 RepID=A0AAD7RT53_9TELE|nr:hypothetical protein AAFF_G00113800 [Aldrovandia affinis]
MRSGVGPSAPPPLKTKSPGRCLCAPASAQPERGERASLCSCPVPPDVIGRGGRPREEPGLAAEADRAAAPGRACCRAADAVAVTRAVVVDLAFADAVGPAAESVRLSCVPPESSSLHMKRTRRGCVEPPESQQHPPKATRLLPST